MRPPLIVSKPCPKKWAELTGDSVRRHCSECNLHVHNLSEMTPRQQREFAAGLDHACIAYETDAKGNFLSKRRFGWLTPFLNFPRAITFSVLATLIPFLFSSCASRSTLGRFNSSADTRSKPGVNTMSLGYGSYDPKALKK